MHQPRLGTKYILNTDFGKLSLIISAKKEHLKLEDCSSLKLQLDHICSVFTGHPLKEKKGLDSQWVRVIVAP